VREYRPRIFNTKAPNSFSTFLIDGQVAGTWRFDDGRIAISTFHRLDKRSRRELDDEAERLAAFYAD
jgi:Winged helix DNA-binding domain